MALIPIVRKRSLDDMLETGKADVDVLVRLPWSIGLAQFRYLTGYTLW